MRGEDSWIRAIWAAKPFIWQPYIQSENTHLTKLKAFIDLYYDGLRAKKNCLEGASMLGLQGMPLKVQA